MLKRGLPRCLSDWMYNNYIASHYEFERMKVVCGLLKKINADMIVYSVNDMPANLREQYKETIDMINDFTKRAWENALSDDNLRKMLANEEISKQHKKNLKDLMIALNKFSD
jgi:hypothetical protein